MIFHDLRDHEHCYGKRRVAACFSRPKIQQVSIVLNDIPCPVCNAPASPLDVVDFNKSCEERNSLFLSPSGTAVYYYLCDNCGFCCAPGFAKWSLDDFAKNIYNHDYHTVDPDYAMRRPDANAASLKKMFPERYADIRHLDYGGGNGRLSEQMKKQGWDSATWDPFMHPLELLPQMGQFNLVTAYEVFEHVPDVNHLMHSLDSTLAPDGLILFTTLLSDGNIHKNKRLNWWYASPRNGHISLFSRTSLMLLAEKFNFRIKSFNTLFHVLYRHRLPEWASHLEHR